MAAVPLSIEEIYQFALRIEERGEAFYRARAKAASGPVAELLTKLATDESLHRKTFSALLKEFANYEPAAAYPDEYFQYLRAYADDAIFSDAAAGRLPAAADPAAVLEFAMARELASVTYYSEMRPFIPRQQQEKLDAIIAQERLHFRQLAELKAKL